METQIIAVGPELPLALAGAVRTAFAQCEYMGIIEQLQIAVGCEVTISGLVVYGGLAQPGRSSDIESSDVDLLLLVEENACGGVFGCADNLQIDLHVQSRSNTLADPTTNWIYAEGQVLFDSRPPELACWLSSLLKWKQEHPDPWTVADHLRGRVWAQRLVEKIIRLGRTDPVVASLHEARLLATIPTLHAQVRKTRTTSIGSWWAALPREDNTFMIALNKYLTQRSSPANAVNLRRLLDDLYAPTGINSNS